MEVECLECSAKFQVPESVKTYTCPYCGLVFGERSEEDHYYFPVMDDDPQIVLLNFLRRQFGIPSDITSSSSLRVKQLHFIPVYFYYLYGRALARCGRSGWTRAEESIYKGVIASRSFIDILKDYPFPVRGKKFFRKEIMDKGFYHQPEFTEEEARRYAENFLYEIIENELRHHCSNIDEMKVEEVKVNFRGLVHYPIYYLEYTYGGERYSSYLDGVDGKIISAEYPINLRTKTIQIATSALLWAIAFTIGIVVSLIIGNLLPFIFSSIPAVASSIPLLRRTISKKVISSDVKLVEEESKLLITYVKRFLS
ncbi:MAG: zinc-ribbon domain-containing protein [Aigarchaeota archaeon]|nr:zinc-ribbon domain-containing protein [Aigarchaeota archaeon]MCX8193329.1 zinc-ribbon domain-containing protein [Nitrososphaeria archaeon]MDW7985859.1 hypothetical protein [Nitrososphaerota archaeon]